MHFIQRQQCRLRRKASESCGCAVLCFVLFLWLSPEQKLKNINVEYEL